MYFCTDLLSFDIMSEVDSYRRGIFIRTSPFSIPKSAQLSETKNIRYLPNQVCSQCTDNKCYPIYDDCDKRNNLNEELAKASDYTQEEIKTENRLDNRLVWFNDEQSFLIWETALSTNGADLYTKLFTGAKLNHY